MGYGALEHYNSSTYLMPYFAQGAVVDMLEPVIAHEYWHLWSPKRIHVDKLGPFNYQEGPRTTSLWFHEGLNRNTMRGFFLCGTRCERRMTSWRHSEIL